MKKSLGARAILAPSPVWCVGTYDKNGKPNVMTASWAGICSSEPPGVMVALRSATLTHGNILASKAFTISVPSSKYIKEADYFGMASGRNTDKFKATGLTPAKAITVNAPYVAEFPLIAECRLLKSTEMGIHTQFIGEILEVKADPGILIKGRLPDGKKLDSFLYTSGDHHYIGMGDILGKAFEIGEKIGQ